MVYNIRSRKGYIALTVVTAILLLTMIFIFNPNGVADTVDSETQLNSISRYSFDEMEASKPATLELDCDKSFISIFCWNRAEIRLETTETLIAYMDKEILENKLEGFNTGLTTVNGKTVLNSGFEGKTGEFDNCYTKISIYVPRDIRSIKGVIEEGSISLMDDLNCDLDITGDSLDIIINCLQGMVECHTGNGDIWINNGLIRKNMDIITEIGNINVKSGFETPGTYNLKTGAGIIDIMVPEELNASFGDGTGYLDEAGVDDETDSAVFNLISMTGMVRFGRY